MMKRVVILTLAANYLYELRDFAVAHDNPELLDLITKSQSIIEETMFKEAKQTKITDFFGK